MSRPKFIPPSRTVVDLGTLLALVQTALRGRLEQVPGLPRVLPLRVVP